MQQKTDRSHVQFRGKWLGTVAFKAPEFSSEALRGFRSPDFQRLSTYDKHDRIARILFRQIQDAPEGSFVLPQVLGFLTKIREYYPSYNFASFEFFLKYFKELSDEEKTKIRGKIAGRYIPRREYQVFFPIGGNVKLEGAHFVVAHFSPDLDTTVASFIGFLDAFAADVAKGRHYWVVPGGPPKGSVEIDLLFNKALGRDCFSILSNSRKRLTLSSMDLLTQHNLIRKRLSDLSYGIHHERSTSGVIVIDDDGHYLADWRSVDFDVIRAMIGRFVGMLREHTNYFHTELISLFARKELGKSELKSFVSAMMKKKLSDCSVGKELTDEHRVELDAFLKKILGLKEGVKASYRQFLDSRQQSEEFTALSEMIESLVSSDLFDKRGGLIDDRAAVFRVLEDLFQKQSTVYQAFFHYLDTLEVAVQIKQEVLGHEPNYLSHMDNFEDIVDKFNGYTNLTVAYEEKGKRYPLGTINVQQLKQRPLGTISMRDFSNFNETDKPEYIEVASVIDHHKSDIVTAKPFVNLSGDCQSSNTLVAKYSMEINDRYSAGGMQLKDVESQLEKLASKLNIPSNIRIFGRLLKKKKVLEQEKNPYFVAYEREFLEYYQQLHAILDDTDLLTKVTEFDVEVVADLLNRLKSLMLRKEVEIIDFDDIARDDADFAKRAAKKLLQSHDLYSIYSISYRAKEENIDALIKATAKREKTHFFQDTKILNKYARIGQFKYFVKNLPTLQKKVGDIRKIWVEQSREEYALNSDISLHAFMLSSVLSAEELFADLPDKREYKDEMWFWIPPGDKRIFYQLTEFLTDFIHIPTLKQADLEVEIYDNKVGYKTAFEGAASGRKIGIKTHKSDLEFAILRIPPRSVTSRKGQVATCL